MLQVQSIADMMYCFIAGRKMFAVSSANVVHRGYIVAIAKEDGSEYNYQDRHSRSIHKVTHEENLFRSLVCQWRVETFV
jgi:hypothetical protein